MKKIFLVILLLLLISGFIYICLPQQQIEAKLGFPESIVWDGSLPDELSSYIKRYVEGLQFDLSYPSKIWLGDSENVQVLLYCLHNNEKLEKSAEPNSHQTEGQNSLNLVLEARLSLNGFMISPGEEIIAPIGTANQVDLMWGVAPSQAGTVQGTLWIYLNAVPVEKGDSARAALFAIPVRIEVVSLAGIPVFWVRFFFLSVILLTVLIMFDLHEVLLKISSKK
ncbi:MAG TPA: hypothetical protein G4N92_01005 [Anaerolineae bacterium]|nr:hypothetical protein [Anaerolineae bacterium]